MDWYDELIDRLAAKPCAGYSRADSPATEPSALAALALAHERPDESRAVADWLAEFQATDGSIGVRPSEREPCWPTSLAMLTWAAQQSAGGSNRFQASIEKAAQWTLSHHGLAMPRTPDSGHDSTIDAWSWVEGTHAWIEPTALHVVALKATGYSQHARTRSAVAMLIDRHLLKGGCNYGNTTVFGRQLRPHVQPTGVALLALAGEPHAECMRRSISFLQQELSDSTTVTSLCWSLLGLAAHQEWPAAAEPWLEAAYRRVLRADGSIYKLALIALAIQPVRGARVIAGSIVAPIFQGVR